MADKDPPVGSNDWITQQARNAAANGVGILNTLTRPRAAADAEAAYEADRASTRDVAESKEGARLEALPAPAVKPKPYTNPDGTPFTREQMRKTVQGKKQGGQVKSRPRGVGIARKGHGKGTMR